MPGERANASVLSTVGGAHFGDEADASDCRHVVADSATRSIERGAQPFLGGLHLEKIIQPDPEPLELGRQQPWQRIAKPGRLAVGRSDGEERDQTSAREDAASSHGVAAFARTRSLPRMKP